ncbi:hypothetical protein GGI20_005374 [Coemansia sp. BCRC 34301]|nr:hypothetical protein GGI20_005374 [Coemansia sp. BCRC 34301]
MDVDTAPLRDFADDDVVAQPVTRVSPALMATQPVAPLSASKSARLLRPVVGTHGVLQSSSHPLLRVLVKQMSAASASAVANQSLAPKLPQKEISSSDQSVVDPTTPKTSARSFAEEETLWKTPMTSAPDCALSAGVATSSSSVGVAAKVSRPSISTPIRVPFSGPPSTPRRTQAPGEQYETPSRSSHLSSADQTPEHGVFADPGIIETPLIAKPKSSRRVREDASSQRYNLRHRTGQPANEGQGTPDVKAQLRAKKAAEASLQTDIIGELTASSKRSASSYERSLRSSDKAAPKQQHLRTRKRE